MLDPAALDRHLKVCHSHFAEKDLFLDDGSRATGFFITKAVGGEEGNSVPENIRHFRSPSRLALGARITDRRNSRAWRVKDVEGEEGAYLHTLEATSAA